jgi:hypothetical protein
MIIRQPVPLGQLGAFGMHFCIHNDDEPMGMHFDSPAQYELPHLGKHLGLGFCREDMQIKPERQACFRLQSWYGPEGGFCLGRLTQIFWLRPGTELHCTPPGQL